jgi:predicted ATPase
MAASRVRESAPLFASLLLIPAGSRYPPLSLSPAQQRRQTLSALLDQMEGLAHQNPVLMLFEDVHWADATSLEVLDLGMERVRQLPVLLLVTFRSEFEPPWKGLLNVTSLALGRLERGDAETLVERVAGGRKLPIEVMAQIVAKTDGVPLFIEELTKTVLESGLLIEDGDYYHLDGPLPPLAIPSTLQDSLMARLDRLALVKEIAQIGAAIGREFTYALLNAVVGRDQASLQTALAQLEEAELVSCTGAVPDARYSFKHMLVRDTAYESLLKSRRQVLHRRIAATLRDKFPSVASAEPEVIAHHFTQAGLDELAIDWWGNAGNFALRRSAFKEAIAHLGKAIAMGDKLAQGTSAKPHASSRLRLQIAYANALIAARGYGAPETTAAFGRARELAAGIEDATERFSVYYGLWVGSFVRGELAIMQESASAILRDCENQPKSSEAGIAHRLSGVTNWFSGNFEEALVHLEQALTIFDPERDGDLAFRFGQDIGVSAIAYSALVLWPLGQIDRANQLAESMAARASQCGHIATAAYGAVHAVVLQVIMGRNPVRAASHIETIVRLARDHEMPLWIAFGSFFEPWARWHLGSRDTSLTEMRRGLVFFREVIGALYVPFVEAALAEVEAEAGEIEAALATMDRAIAETDRTGQRWFEAETHRVRGEILLMRDPANPVPAEESFLAAIAIAQQQRTRSFELRAALGLSKLYKTTNRNADAYAVLAPALEGFSPTPEFPEIERAQVLLATLEAGRSATSPR